NLNYALGSRVNIQAQGTSNGNAAFLIVDNLIRSGNGTLELIRNANTAAPFTNDVSFGAQSRIISTVAPVPVNGMLSPNIVAFNSTALESSFVTYDTTVVGGFAVGITNASYTAGTDFSGTGATTIYDLLGAGTNITTLASPQ